MKRTSVKRTLLTDAAIAVVLVACVLIVVPGLAIVGIAALLLAIVGAASFLIELGTTRRHAHSDPGREDRMRRAAY
jgi:hypothetical protein